MAEAGINLNVKAEKVTEPMLPAAWYPFGSLRNEINRLFDELGGGFWASPFRTSMFSVEPLWRRHTPWGTAPAVDITESEKAYEITAELPGLDQENVEVKLSNGNIMIKGKKQEESEETKKDYYLHERRFGSFERIFQVPEGVDANKIDASFDKGVLHVRLPKKLEARTSEKKIEVKAA
jgi:HSP20 family protein